MTAYIIRRLLIALVVLILVTILVFSAMRLLPGDPLEIFLGQSAGIAAMSEDVKAALYAEYGLDKPPVMQYFDWIGGVVQGDLGRSITYRDDVGTLMAQRFPALLFAIALCLLGTVAVLRCSTHSGPQQRAPAVGVQRSAHVPITKLCGCTLLRSSTTPRRRRASPQ